MVRLSYAVPVAGLALVAVIAGVTVVVREGGQSPESKPSALLSPPVAPSPSGSAPSASPVAVPTSANPSPVPPPPAPTRSTGLPRVPRPGEPVAAADAAGIAQQLNAAHRAVSDPRTGPAMLSRHSHVYQVAVRALVNAPERRAPTYDLLEPRVRPAVTRDVDAGAQLRAMIRRPKSSLPEWRIIAPAPAAELLGYYRSAAREFGVPWEYLAAIHLVETRMGRIRGVSSAGAQGPMQFMPATWRSYGGGGDVNSNRDSIFAAARYLRASGAPANIRKAVYAYNHANRYVDAVLLYAEQMRSDPRAYYGYHGWQVYYVTTAGDVWLPQGFTNG